MVFLMEGGKSGYISTEILMEEKLEPRYKVNFIEILLDRLLNKGF